MASEAEIKKRFSQLEAWLDEHARRLWAAAESAAHGRGGISLVSRASGVSRRAIAVGLAELRKKPDRSQRKHLPIRQKGGGRKKASFKDPDLLLDLEKLLEPVTRGDPQSPLRWTCKSVRNLADELRAQGHKVSHVLVAELLHEQKYSLQANRKTKEGSSHPDRNAQFEYISAKATEFLNSGQPAISVDCNGSHCFPSTFSWWFPARLVELAASECIRDGPERDRILTCVGTGSIPERGKAELVRPAKAAGRAFWPRASAREFHQRNAVCGLVGRKTESPPAPQFGGSGRALVSRFLRSQLRRIGPGHPPGATPSGPRCGQAQLQR